MADTKQRRDDPRVARTRARAFEATLELAAESGLHACTFDAVSERSGIARSTLYRHWSNQSELVMDALESQDVEEPVAHDTGSLRDDMLIHMLGLGRDLEGSTWGAMVPQLVAAASTDPDMSDMLRKSSIHYLRDRRRDHRAGSGSRRSRHRHRLQSRCASVLSADLLPILHSPPAGRWEVDNLTRRRDSGTPPPTLTFNTCGNLARRSRQASQRRRLEVTLA